MPELPEVETIVRSLQPKLSGLTITDTKTTLPKIIRAPEDFDSFKRYIIGRKISEIRRRGKYLLFSLTGDYSLLFHLRMTGNLVYCQKEVTLAKYTHLVIDLDNEYQLRYADMRQFGRVWLLPDAEMENLAGYKDLGIEPLDKNFTVSFLRKELRQVHGRIKPLLLDQTLIAGLGNIYTDEALFRAKINPETIASNLTPRAVSKLHQSIRAVLQDGISNRGTSVRDYVDGDGQPGNFQNFLSVYGKEGKPCKKCGNGIVRKKIGGRSSFYCPICQKL
jgi:formamidopyrimidine-DNA glycosylase